MSEPVGTLPRTATASTWADEVEEEEERLNKALEAPTVGDTSAPAQHAARSPRAQPHSTRQARSLPTRPPYKLYMANLPWELDEFAVERFFEGLEIKDIMILRFPDTGKPKGCFVEFGSQEHLAEALTADGAELMRRAITVAVAEARPDSRGGGDRGRSWKDGGYGAPRGGDGYGAPRGGDGYGAPRGGDRRGPPPPGARRGDRYSSREEGKERSERFTPRNNGHAAGQGEDAERWAPRREVQAVGRSAVPAPATAPAAEARSQAPRSNPFGDARPADTAAKLKALEERIAAKQEAERKVADSAPPPSAAAAPAAGSHPVRPAAILQRRAPGSEGVDPAGGTATYVPVPVAPRAPQGPAPAAAPAPDADGFQEVKGAWGRKSGGSRHGSGRKPSGGLQAPARGPRGEGQERGEHGAPAARGAGPAVAARGPGLAPAAPAAGPPQDREATGSRGGSGLQGRGRAGRGSRTARGEGSERGAHGAPPPQQQATAPPVATPAARLAADKPVVVTRVQNMFDMLNMDEK